MLQKWRQSVQWFGCVLLCSAVTDATDFQSQPFFIVAIPQLRGRETTHVVEMLRICICVCEIQIR